MLGSPHGPIATLSPIYFPLSWSPLKVISGRMTEEKRGKSAGAGTERVYVIRLIGQKRPDYLVQEYIGYTYTRFD